MSDRTAGSVLYGRYGPHLLAIGAAVAIPGKLPMLEPVRAMRHRAIEVIVRLSVSAKMVEMAEIKVKIQISCDSCFALGPGKADLLAAIAEHGSISGAARALGMSYRRAWLLVDEMNRCFTNKPVETLNGGGRERGARLTATGVQALDAYRALQGLGAGLAESAPYRTLSNMIRATPL